MPAVTATAAEEQNDEKMWGALKRYIIRDRQRKKEEYEAEVEEARLRKEREARERQDVMTLEETKEQIEQLEQKMKQLEKEKQQLFMQLKKLLNKDEVRKRQQQKESNEMQPMKMLGNIQMPMFSMPPSSGQGDQSHNQGRPPPMSSHILNKPLGRNPIQSGVKRQRSPSPTYALYAHRLHQPPLKHQPVYSDHKMEDGRMGRQMARAVLWNKPAQYASNVVSSVSSSPAYYAMPSSGVVSVVGERPPPLVYAHHAHAPHTPHGGHGGGHGVHGGGHGAHGGGHGAHAGGHSAHGGGHGAHSGAHGHGGHAQHGSMMYAPAPQPQQIHFDMLKNRDQHQQDSKKDNQPQVLIGLPDGHHPAVSSGYAAPQPRHLQLHPSHAAMQNAKPGSITQGYPVQQSNPNVQNPIAMYPNRHRY